MMKQQVVYTNDRWIAITNCVSPVASLAHENDAVEDMAGSAAAQIRRELAKFLVIAKPTVAR